MLSAQTDEIKEERTCKVLMLTARSCLKKQCGFQFRTMPYQPALLSHIVAIGPHILQKTHWVLMYSILNANNVV